MTRWDSGYTLSQTMPVHEMQSSMMREQGPSINWYHDLLMPGRRGTHESETHAKH